jgi:FkbM family methyltransferase
MKTSVAASRFKERVLDVLLDSKHIADKPSGPGATRWDLWRTYLRLARLPRSGGGGTVDVLGFRVRYLDPANLAHVFREIFVNRLYDVRLAGASASIIDCGSNIGMSILFFKNLYPGARILGFEPSPLTFPVLSQNIHGNRLRDVVLHQTALADKPGRLEFYVNTDEPGALNAGLYGTQRNRVAVPVRAERLSSHIEGEIDLLKLDIEGAEEMVIRELAEHGALRRVRNIVCEYHHHHHRDRDAERLSVTLLMLEQAGFGYQLEAYCGRARPQNILQDILIYAYRKEGIRRAVA